MPDNAFIIYSESEADDRANVRYWREYCDRLDSNAYAVILPTNDEKSHTFTIVFNGRRFDISAFDLGELVKLVPVGSDLVVDISGVDHTFWAGCMVEFKSSTSNLYFIYTEPAKYRRAERTFDPDEFETGLFDLSDRSRGVSPLPRFANLHGPELFNNSSIFVPLLGFEGRRGLNVLSKLDPEPKVVIPIIAVPGYQLEFPSYTVTCNEIFFSLTQSAAKTRFAPANDPFLTRDVLRRVGEEFRDSYMYVAPIGTRPQAVGALMFADEERKRVEILFDHPIRKSESRQGIGRAHLYRIL